MKHEGMAAEDATMTSQGSGLGPIGFQVMQFVPEFVSECQRDPKARLNDFTAY